MFQNALESQMKRKERVRALAPGEELSFNLVTQEIPFTATCRGHHANRHPRAPGTWTDAKGLAFILLAFFFDSIRTTMMSHKL